MTAPITLNDLARTHRPGLDELRGACERVISSGWYVLGNEVAQFERAFADYCGAAQCIGVANGTEALEIALRAVNVGPGDKVVTAANAGMYATVAINACAAEPIFVDVDAANMNMSLAALKAALVLRPRAVVITHLYGRMAAVETLCAAARNAGVTVIEDCAQAHGARLRGQHAGTFGDIACFSFYPTKNLGALGDGGAIVSNDTDLWQTTDHAPSQSVGNGCAMVATGCCRPFSQSTAHPRSRRPRSPPRPRRIRQMAG